MSNLKHGFNWVLTIKLRLLRPFMGYAYWTALLPAGLDSPIASLGADQLFFEKAFLEKIMFRAFAAFLFCLIPVICIGQVQFPQLPQPITAFGFEDKDWGIEATTTPKKTPHSPTPKSIPGGRVIKTLELKELLDSNKSVVVIDVLSAKKSVPGAFFMEGAGDGQFYSAEKSRFSAAMEKLTAGDKARPIVFLCLSSECWLSYNASLHALEAGYQDVIWYRGGINAWTGASLESKQPEHVQW